MRIARFRAGGKTRYGIVVNDVVRGIRGNPFSSRSGSALQEDGSAYGLREVRLLAPCQPTKIIALGVNYRSHAEETGIPLPTRPLIFMKPSTAVIGPEDTIKLPPSPKLRVDYEGELAVVVGKRARNVKEEDAGKYILGYTCCDDVTDRYAQRDDGQWTRAKGYDTFAPLGPWIETSLDPACLKIETRVNGEVKQSGNTADQVFSVQALVCFISGIMTLLPGDVISTGTPAGIGRLNHGDTVEVSIEGIGTLRNFVAAGA